MAKLVLLLALCMLWATPGWGQMSGRDVQWAQIRNMPPGFKDGIDNVTPFSQDFYAQTGDTVDAAVFMPLNGAGYNAASTRVQNLVARTGTFSDLACHIHAPAGRGSEWTVTLHTGVGPAPLTCSINHPTQTCRDPTNTASVKVGDLVYYAITQTGTPAPTHFTCTLRLTE